MGKQATFVLLSLDAADASVGSMLPHGTITPEVAQHLKSRRVSRGEEIEFLNGRGLRALCVCEDAPSLRYRVKESQQESPLSPRIELYLALPKGEILSEAVAQATEIGVSKIVFLKTDHAQVPKELLSPPLARAERIADAACEQCARAWKMEFEPGWATLESALADEATTKVLADEGLSSSGRIGFEEAGNAPSDEAFQKSIRLFIGPEGGWSEKERQFFDGRAFRLGLGSLILRVPTAVVAASFYLRQRRAAF